MYINIPATSRRQSALEAFRRFNLRARLARSLRSILRLKNGTLADFDQRNPLLNPTRTLRGRQDIPVERIIGSLGRATDFDRDFRPLKKHLRDRWVDNYLTGTDRWEPIRVHKVGQDYFVEDGHHRVSVARYTGMAFIPAEVWEYSLKPAPRVMTSGANPVRRRAVAPCYCEPCPAG